MPANTARGYPYPLGTDRLMDGDDAIHSLATAVDNQVGIVQSGTLQITPSGANTTTTAAVTFPIPYPAPPIVVAGFGNTGSSMSPGVCSLWTGTATTTGFNVSLQRANTGVQGVTWIAKG